MKDDCSRPLCVALVASGSYRYAVDKWGDVGVEVMPGDDGMALWHGKSSSALVP